MLTVRRLTLAFVLLAALPYAGDALAVRVCMATGRAPFGRTDVEQRSDKLSGGHGLLRSRQDFTLLTSVEKVPDQCKAVKEYYELA